MRVGSSYGAGGHRDSSGQRWGGGRSPWGLPTPRGPGLCSRWCALRDGSRLGGGHPRPAHPEGTRVASQWWAAWHAPVTDRVALVNWEPQSHGTPRVSRRKFLPQRPSFNMAAVAALRAHRPAPPGPLTPDDVCGPRLESSHCRMAEVPSPACRLCSSFRNTTCGLWSGDGVEGRGKVSPKPEAQSPREETGTPNPVRPTEGLGQAWPHPPPTGPTASGSSGGSGWEWGHGPGSTLRERRGCSGGRRGPWV